MSLSIEKVINGVTYRVNVPRHIEISGGPVIDNFVADSIANKDSCVEVLTPGEEAGSVHEKIMEEAETAAESEAEAPAPAPAATPAAPPAPQAAASPSKTAAPTQGEATPKE